jgi:peptidoglycan LD-endopeptidase CwlK
MSRTEEMLAGSVKGLSQVHPILRQRVNQLIQTLGDNGLYFGAFMGLRTFEEQDALYAQGRTTPGNQVTKARGGESLHNFGLAVDLVEDGDPNKAGIQWSWANNADYIKLGKYTAQAGLEWGGFWKSFKDYPHVEITGGLSLSAIKLLYNLGGIQNVWEHIDARLT